MGTHPIFESDFDCLTDGNRASIWLTLVSTDLDAWAVSSPVPLWDVRMLTLWPSMTPSSIWTTWYTCTNMTQLTESSTELSKPLTASSSRASSHRLDLSHEATTKPHMTTSGRWRDMSIQSSICTAYPQYKLLPNATATAPNWDVQSSDACSGVIARSPKSSSQHEEPESTSATWKGHRLALHVISSLLFTPM